MYTDITFINNTSNLWQCAPVWIQFKLVVIVYRALRGMAPRYLSNLLRRVADIPSWISHQLSSVSQLDVRLPCRVGMYRISGSRWPDIPPFFSNPVPVPAKTVPGTGYLSRIVLGPFWQLVELSSPSKWAPYCKHVHLNSKELVSHVDQLFYIY